MSIARQPLTFNCEGETLVGILTRPARATGRGVLIVVGGPQYRVGSHRQFALLADDLAARGMAVLRFDFRGMGDSSGEIRDFEHRASDVRAAVDVFFELVHELREVVIWGLCDGASAALLYAPGDRRITGLVLLNPWMHSVQAAARARLKLYYWHQLWRRDTWRRLMSRKIDMRESARSLTRNLADALTAESGDVVARAAPGGQRLESRMADALGRFDGRVLIILAGQDLTAREFEEKSRASRNWRRLLTAPRVERRELPDATHTFSRRAWRDQVANWTADWLGSW